MEHFRRLRQWLQRSLLGCLKPLFRLAPSGPVRRIAVLEMTRLGDVVAATTLIRPLRRAFPEAALELWAAGTCAGLFDGDPGVEFTGLSSGGFAFLRDAWKLRHRLRQSGLLLVSASPAARHTALVLLSSPVQALGYLFPNPGGLGYDETHCLEARGGGPRRTAFSGREDHLVTRARRILDLAGLPLEGAEPVLHSTVARRSRRAVLHAGANWAWRRWPLERFVELGQRLKAAGWEPLLVAAEAGPPRQDPGFEVCPNLSLSGLRDLLASASLFVGNDSGPLHLAAALGTPCLGLFGPNLESRSGPWPQGAASPHRVLWEEVPCRPCSQTACLQPHDWCMAKLQAQRVHQVIGQAFKEAA